MPVPRNPRAWVATAILLAVAGSAAGQTRRARSPQTFAGAPFDAARASALARADASELIDFHACAGGAGGCALIAVRRADGEAFVYRVSERRCQAGEAPCLGGYAARSVAAETRGKPARGGSRAKTSAKPGEDGAPPDPQHQAQADATNEIIEALGDGKYEGAYEQFWKDLESIQTWDHPSWREPDPPPTVQDAIRTLGAPSAQTAVLISGRFWPQSSAKECRRWEGYKSSAPFVGDIGNWIGNAPFDGCDSEVAVFSDKDAAQLIGTERRWSKSADSLDYPASPAINVPTTVWIVYARNSFAEEEARILGDFEVANKILADSRCGVALGPVVVKDRTSALADPAQSIGCEVESLLKPEVGFAAGRMNVYVVNQLENPERAGVACTQQSENVIVVDQGRYDNSLLHEYGHWFDLWHTNPTGMPLVDKRNVMSDVEKDKRNILTAGQCYRVNFSKDSYLHKQGLRSGKTRNCRHLQDADEECPGLKNEF